MLDFRTEHYRSTLGPAMLLADPWNLTPSNLYEEVRYVEGGRRLGRAMLILRNQLGLTQEELATRAGLVNSYISRLENGAFERPSYKTLNALAHAAGLADAGVLMRRLEEVDRTMRAPDPEADRIRALADKLAGEIAMELAAIPEQYRAAAADHAVKSVRQFGSRRRTISGGTGSGATR